MFITCFSIKPSFEILKLASAVIQFFISLIVADFKTVRDKLVKLYALQCCAQCILNTFLIVIIRPFLTATSGSVSSVDLVYSIILEFESCFYTFF
jgi:hypothetical protein